MSTEQRELDLVEKVDFRILGASNNEEKLQQLLKVYLPPLLLKLGSEHASVRNKVTAICQRLPTFIQAPGIILPVEALLDQYKAAESTLVKYFDIVFIQHSLDRLDSYERRKLIPKVTKGIGSDRQASLSNLFNILLRLLHDLRLPPRGSKEDESFREDMGLSDPKDAQFIAEWLGKLLLLRANVPGAATSPGLTVFDVSFLTLGNKKETWTPASKGLSLPETRIKAVNFLASGAFTDDERFMPALHAAASSDFRLSSVGDDILKRTTVSLEDKGLVKKLFEAHSQLSPPYRVRILGLLSKSEVSTTFTDEILAAFKQNVASQAGGATGASAGGDEMDVDSAPPNTKATSGLELTKLRKATFEYIYWVARIGPSKRSFQLIGPPLVSLLQEFIQSQGWPRPTKNHLSLDETTLRSVAYEAIGVLAKGTITMSAIDRLDLAEWLFRSLSEDPSASVVNIDGALSSFSSIMQAEELDDAVSSRLRSLLLRHMNLDENTFNTQEKKEHQEGEIVPIRSARHAAAKWANNCLPFSDVVARWIDILAVAGRRNERIEVIEEGRKGLDPWTYYASDEKGPKVLPPWQHMVRLFFKEDISRSVLGNGGIPQTITGQLSGGNRVFQNFQGDALMAFPEALKFCSEMLFLTALSDSFKLEVGWERRLDTTMDTDLAARRALRWYLNRSEPSDQAASYSLLVAAFEGMVRDDDRVDTDWCVKCAATFVDLATFMPKMVMGPLITRWRELIPLIRSDKREMRGLASIAMGILGAHPQHSAEEYGKIRHNLLGLTKGLELGVVGSDLNAAEGACMALGYLISRRIFYGLSVQEDGLGLQGILPTLASVSSKGASTQEALFIAYSQIWTAGAQTADVAERKKFEKAFLEPLVVQAKKGNEIAIKALGSLSISLPVKDDTDEDDDGRVLHRLILDKLFALYEIKQAEVHFAVGEAIATAAAFWDAEVVQLKLDVEVDPDMTFRIPKKSPVLESVLGKLLLDCKTTKPSLLKASGIWLFCIIQHCSHLPEVQSKLRESQVAFMRLLSARDELVQETASRGLGLVYEKGDPELKKQLVKDLVSSFTGTSPKLKVEEDTELFAAGALPTGEGKSVTSYRDILNLASEVGDQSLVYKFMSLATNAAAWSTRSAFGRFGLSNILSESEVDPKLYPVLYRYTFDPNPNVAKSMKDIWKALVKDDTAVIEPYFDAIITDLLKNILGKEWRAREASCAAISDLISGRPFAQYERYYKAIWAAALKVLDDVKGTVRKAALHLCIALSNTLVRQLEGSDSSSAAASAMMNEALPFLLSDKAMESSVEEVKVFATVTVIKICKVGGRALNPYIATTVPHLLGILSTLESDSLNYYYQRLGEDMREKIDKARSAAVSQHPITEAIENLLRTADAEVMAALAPKLEEAINSAIGIPTKIGCARVLTTLSMRHANDFRPFAGRFLTVLGEKPILDRNDEVSQGYARAAAYVVRAAPDTQQLRFVARLQRLYFTSEDETRRQKVADAVLALAKISPDHFNALESQLLPFAYLAKHDTSEYVRKACEEVWDKQAGSELSITRYVAEIVQLVQQSMGTSQWGLRHSAAFTVADAVSAVLASNALSGSVDTTMLEKIWPEFEKVLALKTFEGKEKVLEPFPSFVERTKALWHGENQKKGFGDLLKKIALREAKRNNDDYRPHAFKCLWKFAAVREDLDMLGDIVGVVGEYISLDEDDEDGEKMDLDDPKSKKDAYNKTRGVDPKSVTIWAAIEAIARGYNRLNMKKDPIGELGRVVEAFEGLGAKGSAKIKDWWGGEKKPLIAAPVFDILRRVYWYECLSEGPLKDAVNALAATSEGINSEVSKGDIGQVMGWLLATLDLDKPDMGTEEVRLTRVRATLEAVKVIKGAVGEGAQGVEDLLKRLQGAVEHALKEERSAVVQAKWKEVSGLVKAWIGDARGL